MTQVSCARAAPSHAAAIGWLQDGRRPGPMDSAELPRAGRRGTCRTAGGGAWQRCARVRAAGAWSAGAWGSGRVVAAARGDGDPVLVVRLCPALHVDLQRSIQPLTYPFTPMDTSNHLAVRPPIHPGRQPVTPSIHPHPSSPTYLFMHPTVLPSWMW